MDRHNPGGSPASPAPTQPRVRPTMWAEDGGQYEYRVISIPREQGRSETRRMLTDEAEYGRWELARSVLYMGGARRVWLRRKIIRVRSTL